MTADEYIAQVVNHIPPGIPLGRQVAMELRSLIAERIEHGQSLDEALRQLGDPAALAESYLSAVPLVNAPFWPRAAAKIVDTVIVCVVVSALAVAILCIGFALVLLFRASGANDELSIRDVVTGGGVLLAICGVLLLVLIGPTYFAVSEYILGQTLGKRLFNLRVVRESGARISFGQSAARQLPSVLGFFWIDVIFALFTDRSQRAFEVISKTRCVVADGPVGTPA